MISKRNKKYLSIIWIVLLLLLFFAHLFRYLWNPWNSWTNYWFLFWSLFSSFFFSILWSLLLSFPVISTQLRNHSHCHSLHIYKTCNFTRLLRIDDKFFILFPNFLQIDICSWSCHLLTKINIRKFLFRKFWINENAISISSLLI